VAGLGVILSAVYMLWMFQRVYYGEVTHEHNRHMPDLSLREWAVIGPLAAMAIYMGVFPNVFLKPMEPAITRIVERVERHEPMQVRFTLPWVAPAPTAATITEAEAAAVAPAVRVPRAEVR
jgi:NADH-quinone oxidoreductase subunit M